MRINLYPQIRRGSTAVVILAVLSQEKGPQFPIQIKTKLSEQSDGFFEFKDGLLYPTLHRMEKDGLIQSSRTRAPYGRVGQAYSITSERQYYLERSKQSWSKFTRLFFEIVGVEL